MKRCPDCQSTYPNDVNHCFVDGQRLVTEPDEEDPLVGSLLDGRFRLEARLGQGGMGAVYRGIQEPVGRPVAIKVLHPELARDKRAVQRFFHEAKVVSKLRHPNTVTLYDFGQADSGELFIAMEHLAGDRLDQRMAEAPLQLDELLNVVDQICQSLAEAHGAGIVHRDLKPDNVFIDQVAGRNLVKVFDFGIAKVPDAPRLTQTGMVFGTPAFMSPEQAQGFELDARSDLYALGVMLYWLLSARLPFQGDGPMQIALRHVTERPVPIAEVSRYQPMPISLETLVMELLEKRPERRPQSSDEVRRRLRAVERELASMSTEAQGADGASSPTTLKEPWSKSQAPSPNPPAAVSRPRESATGVEPIDAPTAELESRSFWRTHSGRLFLAAGSLLVLAGSIAIVRDLEGGSGEPAAELEIPAIVRSGSETVTAHAETGAELYDWVAIRDSAAVRVARALRTAEVFAVRVVEQQAERARVVHASAAHERARRPETSPSPASEVTAESAEPAPTRQEGDGQAIIAAPPEPGLQEQEPDVVDEDPGGLMAPLLVH